MVKKNLGIDGPIYVAPDVNVYAEKPKEPETNTGIMGLVRAIGRDLIGADPDKYMYSEGLSFAPVRKDIETGKIQPSFPGIFRSAAQEIKRVGAFPGKAVRGEEVSPQEATDFALTFTGASVLAPKPSGVVATMGIGKAPQTQKIKPEKTKFGTYSKLEESILNLPQDKYQAKDVLSKLQKTEGVKEDELKWTGIGNLLEGKDKVTKQELVDHIQKNKVNIAEVPLGLVDEELRRPSPFEITRQMTDAEREESIRLATMASQYRSGSPEREQYDQARLALIRSRRDTGHVVGSVVEGDESLVDLDAEVRKYATETGAKVKDVTLGASVKDRGIEQNTYWAVGSPAYGYKIMRNNELAFDASTGVTSNAFKKDFERVLGEEANGLEEIYIDPSNSSFMVADTPQMQTLINNLNNEKSLAGSVRYPQYTLSPQKIKKGNKFEEVGIQSSEVNYREIPVGFDDATLSRVQQKQRELGEGVGKLETETRQGQTKTHYGMNEIGFYNVQDRNLPGFGKTFSVEHLQSDYGAAKGKLKLVAKQLYLNNEDVRLATKPRYTLEQKRKLIPKEMQREATKTIPNNFGNFYIATPYDYLKQSLDGNHFNSLRSKYDDYNYPQNKTIIPPLDEILKVLNPLQKRRYEAMKKRLDDSLDQIDFASAKKGKAVTADKIKQYDEGLITEGEAMGVLVPSAPITTKEPDVIKLMIRTALQRAAREDYDAISFPSGEVISTIDAIDPGQKGITIYDKILPKEINKIMKKIGGKKYDDDNYFTKKEFYSSDKDPTSPDMPSQRRGQVIDTDVLPEDNFLRVIPLSKEIKKKLLEEGAETFKEGGSIIASNPYGNYEPRAI